MRFKAFLEKFADAAAHVARRADDACLDHWDERFDVDEEGVRQPKHRGLRLADESEAGHLPEPGLVGPSSMGLGALVLETETDIGFGADGELEVELTRKLLKRRSRIKIRARFDRTHAAEGIQIVQEAMHGRTREAVKSAVLEWTRVTEAKRRKDA